MSKSVYKCRKKYPRLPLNRLDSTLHNSARYDTPLTLRHSCQLFRTTFSRIECWNFPSDSYLQWYFLLLVSEVVTYLAQNRQLSSMIDISVFVWGTFDSLFVSPSGRSVRWTASPPPSPSMLFRRLANLPQASSYLLRSYYHHYYSYHHHFHFHFHLYLLFTTFVTTTSSFISPFLLLYLLFQPAYFLTYAFIIYLYYITCIYVSQNTHTWPPFDCVQRSILLNDVLKLGYQV